MELELRRVKVSGMVALVNKQADGLADHVDLQGTTSGVTRSMQCVEVTPLIVRERLVDTVLFEALPEHSPLCLTACMDPAQFKFLLFASTAPGQELFDCTHFLIEVYHEAKCVGECDVNIGGASQGKEPLQLWEALAFQRLLERAAVPAA